MKEENGYYNVMEEKGSLVEERLYQAVYWAVRDVFESALEEAARKLGIDRATKGTVLLNILYEAFREGAYRALKEALSNVDLLELVEKTEFFERRR